jgi:hypothetical protein
VAWKPPLIAKVVPCLSIATGILGKSDILVIERTSGAFITFTDGNNEARKTHSLDAKGLDRVADNSVFGVLSTRETFAENTAKEISNFREGTVNVHFHSSPDSKIQWNAPTVIMVVEAQPSGKSAVRTYIETFPCPMMRNSASW